MSDMIALLSRVARRYNELEGATTQEQVGGTCVSRPRIGKREAYCRVSLKKTRKCEFRFKFVGPIPSEIAEQQPEGQNQ